MAISCHQLSSVLRIRYFELPSAFRLTSFDIYPSQWWMQKFIWITIRFVWPVLTSDHHSGECRSLFGLPSVSSDQFNIWPSQWWMQKFIWASAWRLMQLVTSQYCRHLCIVLFTGSLDQRCQYYFQNSIVFHYSSCSYSLSN